MNPFVLEISLDLDLSVVTAFHAGANYMPRHNFLVANTIGSLGWAISYGYGAYALGREFERLEGSVMIFFAIATVITFIVGGIFVHRHEAQLTAEAERALPGPLQPLGAKVVANK